MSFFSQHNEISAIIKTRSRVFWTLAAFTSIINILMLTPSVYMLQIYDRVIPSGNEITLLMLTTIMLGMYAVMSLLEYVRSMVVIRLGSQLDNQLNDRVYTASFESNLNNGCTETGQMLRDLSVVRQFLTGNALFAFFDVPWFPIYLFVIFVFNPWLGLFSLVGALILIFLAIINEVFTRNPLKEASQLSIISGELAGANLNNAEVIAALGMLPNLKARWHVLHLRFLECQRVASERSAKVISLTKFVRVSLQSLILGLGCWLVIDEQLTPGMMIAGSILMGRTLAPIEQVINVWKTYSAANFAYHRLVKLLQDNPKRNYSMSLERPKGYISVENVTVTPPGHQVAPVLHNISFKIQPGDCLGIIGPSASGKSTLARLLVGIWNADDGVVRVDDADISQWNNEELGPSLGYLPQNIELFSGTIAENIARFNTVSSDKVIAAATLAGVHELILHLPQGYDTWIGSGGVGLSGGQKQRIALARALYNDPAIVVLDEPNSNLDEAGEQALLLALQALKKRNKTIVLITHRPGLLSATDKILLLVKGKVSLFGATERVMEALTKSKE